MFIRDELLFFQEGGGAGQFPKKSCTAKSVKKNRLRGAIVKKIEQVLLPSLF